MKKSICSFILSLGIISMSGSAFSQGGNSTGTQMWPTIPPVGIGTQFGIMGGTPLSALHINNDYSTLSTLEAIIRLSNGGALPSDTFAILGLMPPGLDRSYSSLSRGQDLILHENTCGDIIITNYWPFSSPTHETGGSIRFATAGYTVGSPLPVDSSRWRKDYERLTIGIGGNIGIDLPPTSTSLPDTALDTVLDQVQIGGGSVAPLGELDPLPGLTISGGYPWEGLPILGSGTFPADWRYIGFNYGIDHSNPSSSRFFRMARMGASQIAFTNGVNGDEEGVIQLNAYPYDVSRGMHDFTHGVTLQVYGQTGLSLWSYEDTTDPYHHYFDVTRIGVLGSGITRNPYGLFFHNTPVYIGIDTFGHSNPDFANLSIKPDIGDDTTFLLVVNGPGLMKELFIDDSNWADYVFDPGYKLPPLGEVENYIKENHHFPDIEPASKIAKTGVPVGRTEEALTKKVEELTPYTIQLNKELEELKSEVQDLKNEKGK
jgi:hypothetical protein